MSQSVRYRRRLRTSGNLQEKIIVWQEQNGSWSAEMPDTGEKIIGDSKSYVINLAKSEFLKGVADLLESSDIELNSIAFKAEVISNNSLFTKRRRKLYTYKEKLINWTREEPYFESFLEMTINTSVLWIIILVLFLVVLIMLLVQATLRNNQLWVTILASLLAFLGVMLTIAIQVWSTIYKNRVERQKEASDTMKDYYENILNIIKNPGQLALEEALIIINEFDNKSEMYSSANIVYQWKKLKPKLVLAHSNISKIEGNDYHNFKNFVAAVRKEMGHISSPNIRSYIHKDLKFKYEETKKQVIE